MTCDFDSLVSFYLCQRTCPNRYLRTHCKPQLIKFRDELSRSIRLYQKGVYAQSAQKVRLEELALANRLGYVAIRHLEDGHGRHRKRPRRRASATPCANGAGEDRGQWMASAAGQAA